MGSAGLSTASLDERIGDRRSDNYFTSFELLHFRESALNDILDEQAPQHSIKSQTDEVDDDVDPVVGAVLSWNNAFTRLQLSTGGQQQFEP